MTQWPVQVKKNLLRALHDLYLLLGQSVQFVNKRVDTAVGGVDLSLEEGLFVVSAGEREFFMQIKHGGDKKSYLVEGAFIGRR